MASNSGSANERTVMVRFRTQLPKELKVPETPFAVPLRLARRGLSEILNHLLQLNPPRPFEFLANGSLLRHTLDSHIQKNKLSTESVLDLEYFEAMSMPKHSHVFEHEDWVSAILDPHCQSLILSGSFDHMIRLWNSKNVKKPVAIQEGHEEGISSLVMLGSEKNDDSFRFASGARNGSLKVWQASVIKDQVQFQTLAKSQLHTGSVEDLSISKRSSGLYSPFMCSASVDHSIGMWDVRLTNTSKNEEATSSLKRRRVRSGAQTSVQELQHVRALIGHKDRVSGVSFNGESKIVSGSWDKSIRFWDSESGASMQVMHSSAAIHCIRAHWKHNIVATGHSDTFIRVWDPRSTDDTVMKRGLRSHRNWVVSLDWHPFHEQLLASASYDGKLKIWDIRSNIPLHTLDAHDERALCIHWSQNGKQLLSGGTDSKIHIHSIPVRSV